ncbi:SMP-30/gluconolactonase/LRE family protein [Longimicrobium sp.]|uniref:SMP-30/gluconolactonase/LRE family protein n=1 Tax=Longimicrobium sp. TaxID=2029185 RepID=UPI002E32056C|nr:SMP-30/gluconolactonase/LRE family protein [Longimicrobium sp.]HEX6036906.1 SMP-30/gluconolactonase/LRE family protein [Longimicrobium sp.]
MTNMRRMLGAAGLALLAACGGEKGPEPDIKLLDVGFADPESVLHDSVADVYLVSNLNGSPLDKDGNGFIARVLPSGDTANMHWLGSGGNRGMLNAPKGMGIVADTLYVADIDVVRRFHRVTGAMLGEVPIPGSTFLNDIATGPDGSVYVTDMGLKMGGGRMEASGSAAIHRILPGGRVQTLAKGPEVGTPNGIVVDADGTVTIAGYTTGEVVRIAPNGTRTVIPAPRRGQLDGLVRERDGALLVSDWKRSAVYRVRPDAEPEIAVPNLPSPADIGYDARRNRLLVPLMTVNRVEIYALP